MRFSRSENAFHPALLGDKYGSGMPCNLRFEKLLWAKGIPLVAGIDEAGRGPLAGPVVAAAVIVPAGFCCRGINDSKQLTPSVREQFFDTLTAPGALISFGIGVSDSLEI